MCLGPYDSPRGGASSWEGGTPVHGLPKGVTPRLQVEHHGVFFIHDCRLPGMLRLNILRFSNCRSSIKAVSHDAARALQLDLRDRLELAMNLVMR